jgi:hypothetical protein
LSSATRILRIGSSADGLGPLTRALSSWIRCRRNGRRPWQPPRHACSPRLGLVASQPHGRVQTV